MSADDTPALQDTSAPARQYVKDCRTKGFSDQAIKGKLLQSGYNERLIGHIFSVLDGQSTPTTSQAAQATIGVAREETLSEPWWAKRWVIWTIGGLLLLSVVWLAYSIYRLYASANA